MTEAPHLQVDPNTGASNFTERDFVGISHTSGCDWREVFRVIQMPKDVSGLSILDVGAGASDAVAELLRLGADAYAIDPAYHNSDRLREITRKNNVEGFRNYPDIFKLRAASLSRFTQSIRENPERYIDGIASEMPFPDDYFDIVYSRIAIFSYLDIDIDVLNATINECLRVVKPGGTIRLHPFMDTNTEFNEVVETARLNNNQRLLSRMKVDPQVERIEIIDFSTPDLHDMTLVIYKSKVDKSSK